MDVRDGIVNVNGAAIHYDALGAGHPLVLVHAGICDRRMWAPQLAPFAAHFRVIAYDLRGYGQTAIPDGPYSHVADLLGLMDALALQQAHLLGCSRGGATALDLALAQPERVSALVLVSSGPSGYKPPQPVAQSPQWPAVIAAFDAGDLERAAELEVQVWVDGPTRAPDQVPAPIRDLVREMDLRAMRYEVAAEGKAQPQEPERPAAGRLGEVRAPMLVMWGDVDAPITLSSSPALAAGIPGARSVIMSGAAHLPNLEQPDKFNQIVLEFLAAAEKLNR
jgi:pimeloyl-ACP methyl ester carboxylesterase